MLKVSSGEEILPQLLRDISDSRPFDHESGAVPTELSRLLSSSLPCFLLLMNQALIVLSVYPRFSDCGYSFVAIFRSLLLKVQVWQNQRKGNQTENKRDKQKPLRSAVSLWVHSPDVILCG